MQLAVWELGLEPDLDQLDQKIKAPADRDVLISAIRPHLYVRNAPSGSVKLQIWDEGLTSMIAESESITITDISAADFFHGYVRFYIDARLKKDTLYNVRLLSGNGYSFNESAFVGLCKDFDLRKYEASYTPNEGMRSAFDLEFWEQKNVIKGDL